MCEVAQQKTIISESDGMFHHTCCYWQTLKWLDSNSWQFAWSKDAKSTLYILPHWNSYYCIGSIQYWPLSFQWWVIIRKCTRLSPTVSSLALFLLIRRTFHCLIKASDNVSRNNPEMFCQVSVWIWGSMFPGSHWTSSSGWWNTSVDNESEWTVFVKFDRNI